MVMTVARSSKAIENVRDKMRIARYISGDILL